MRLVGTGGPASGGMTHFVATDLDRAQVGTRCDGSVAAGCIWCASRSSVGAHMPISRDELLIQAIAPRPPWAGSQRNCELCVSTRVSRTRHVLEQRDLVCEYTVRVPASMFDTGRNAPKTNNMIP